VPIVDVEVLLVVDVLAVVVLVVDVEVVLRVDEGDEELDDDETLPLPRELVLLPSVVELEELPAVAEDSALLKVEAVPIDEDEALDVERTVLVPMLEELDDAPAPVKSWPWRTIANAEAATRMAAIERASTVLDFNVRRLERRSGY